jgi:DNA ligase-associated metallophosphoesterase
MNGSDDISEMVAVTCDGQRLALLAERAVYWPAERTAIIADPHFGKPATFAAAGIPVPHGVTAADLDRLSAMLARTGATRLVVLGDLFHARSSHDAATLSSMAAWRQEWAAVEMLLVEGNHDRHAGPVPRDLRIREVGACLRLGPLALRHDPADARDGDGYVLAGHVHPCLNIGLGREPGLRLPCFLHGPRRSLLPSFGTFTGMEPVTPAADDRAYVFGPDGVVAVPPLSRRRRSAGARN